MSAPEPEFVRLMAQAGEDPEALPAALESLNDFTSRLNQIASVTAEVEAGDGQVRASVKVGGEVTQLWVDPRLVQRGGTELGALLREAQHKGAELAFSAAQADYESLLGVQLPPVDAATATHENTRVKEALSTAADSLRSESPEVADRLKAFAQQIDGLQDEEFSGHDADGVVTVRIGFAGLVAAVEADRVRLRELDNHEVASKLLDAYRQALASKARRLEELHAIIDPGRHPMADPGSMFDDIPLPRIGL